MKSDQETIAVFKELVNMGPDQLEQYLESNDSKRVGYKHEGEGEAVGHKSGRHIVEILRKNQDEYTEEDVAHMHKVVGYIHRHLAQRQNLTKTDPEHSKWRYSLMNWGHDPLSGEEE